ncbi:hypothetical protein [Dethiobacter alkaliphilus]|uniref:hypothetical protein n=1 Tax=Dethiobacter alkaliphilus TaxID=427926 RepID=UPI0022278546|nr:hypothetical protein [Dethiobacter alkaliphilus]MCW3490611.1 hypothetical protein [Dethiobacter alkaliphilus]
MNKCCDKKNSPKTGQSFNILVNASNQANLADVKDLNTQQINSIFLLVSPYYVEKFNMEGLDLDIKIDDDGILWVGNQCFEPIEVARGVKIIGISKR